MNVVNAAIAAIPRVALAARHVAGCTVLADRTALLEEMPNGRFVAELGCDTGDFSAAILRSARPASLVFVDACGIERYNEDKASLVRHRFSEQIADGTLDIDRRRPIDAPQDYDDASFDWIFVDTDHSYQTTIAELRLWAPKVKPGGFIAGHDYVAGNFASGYKYGVIEAVAQLSVDQEWRLSHWTADFTENKSFAITRL